MTANITLGFKEKRILLWLVMLLMPIAGMGIYLFMPSLPAIMRNLGTTKSLIQLSVSFYIFGTGIPQFIFGIWSDRVGRRIFLLPALLLFVLLTLAIPFSPNIYILLILRLFQGIAVAVPEVLIKALMSDVYENEELDKNTNYLVMAWTIAPIIAPVIGGVLQQQFGWKYPFYFLCLYSFIGFIMCYFLLPETNPHPQKLNIIQLLHVYVAMLTKRAFVAAIVCMVLIYSIITIFNNVGPFLAEQVLRVSPTGLGNLTLALGIAWLIGNAANRFHARRRDLDTVIIYRTIFLFIVSVAMTLLAAFKIVNYWTVVVPLFLLFYGCGVIFPRLFSRALGMFPHFGGATAAILGTLLMVGAAVTTGFASLLATTTPLPLSLTYIILTLVFAVVYWFGVHLPLHLNETFKKR